MYFRTLSAQEKSDILRVFGLAYILRDFDKEIIPEGRADTKFRLMVNNRGIEEEVILTIYETPDVHFNGRDSYCAEVSALYGTHVAQKLISFNDRRGVSVDATVPSPYKTKDTDIPFIKLPFNGIEKIVTITPFIEKAKDCMDASDCERAGKALAAMHLAAQDFTGVTLPNSFGLDHFTVAYNALMARREEVAAKLSEKLDIPVEQADSCLIQTEKLLDKTLPKWSAVSSSLASGWINGDYFPDNALPSKDGKFVTVDLGMVCQDTLLYDLGIGLNAWSFSGSECNRAAASSFLVGYNAVRELPPKEIEALPIAAAMGSLRWTLSRITTVIAGITTRSPIDTLNQARFWDIFVEKGQKIDISSPTISDSKVFLGLR